MSGLPSTTESGSNPNDIDTDITSPPQLQQFAWAESPTKENRPTYVSSQLPVNQRPIMLARDAEGDRDNLMALKDIACFLRDTSPATNVKRESWHATRKVPAAQGKLVKRVFKVGGRKALRNVPYEAVANRSSKNVRNVNYAQRTSKSGHKYIHITPQGSSSLGSKLCEVEANEERSMPTTQSPSKPSTALPRILAPSMPATHIGSPPKTAPADARASANSDIENYVTALQDEMSQRWQSPGKMRGPALTSNPSPKKAASSYRWTPHDRDVSAILRATPRSTNQSSPTSQRSARLLTDQRHGPHTPSRALTSHPAKPSPPPKKPLPEVPGSRKASDASFSSTERFGGTTTPPGDTDIHPLFRNSPDRTSPHAWPFQPVPRKSPLRRSYIAPQDSPRRSNGGFMDQSTSPRTMNDSQRPSAAPADDQLAPTTYVSPHRYTPEPLVTPTESEDAEPRPPTPTPSNRENRIRARKLRHLQMARQSNEVRPKPPPTPEDSPTEGNFDSRPSTAVSTVPTMTSSITATMTHSPIISVVDESSAEDDKTPTPSQVRGHRKPSPLLLSPHRGRRTSDLAEPSPPFPFDDPPLTASTNRTTETTQELRELLPPIRLPPLKPSPKTLANQKELTSSSSTLHINTDSFPLPHQRLSFASSTSQPNSMPSQSHPGKNEKVHQSSHNAKSSTATNGTTTSTSSTISLNARVTHLERQNKLLEAALFAVLRTGGLINGCADCAEHTSSSRPPSSASISALTTSRTHASDLPKAELTSRFPHGHSSKRYSAIPEPLSTSNTTSFGTSFSSSTLNNATDPNNSAKRTSSQYSRRSQMSPANKGIEEILQQSPQSEHALSSGNNDMKRHSSALDLYKATRMNMASMPADVQMAAGSAASAHGHGLSGAGNVSAEGSPKERKRLSRARAE